MKHEHNLRVWSSLCHISPGIYLSAPAHKGSVNMYCTAQVDGWLSPVTVGHHIIFTSGTQYVSNALQSISHRESITLTHLKSESQLVPDLTFQASKKSRFKFKVSLLFEKTAEQKKFGININMIDKTLKF